MLLTLSINIPVIVRGLLSVSTSPGVFSLLRSVLSLPCGCWAKIWQFQTALILTEFLQWSLITVCLLIQIHLSVWPTLWTTLHCRSCLMSKMSVERKMLQKVWSGLKLGTRPASVPHSPHVIVFLLKVSNFHSRCPSQWMYYTWKQSYILQCNKSFTSLDEVFNQV